MNINAPVYRGFTLSEILTLSEPNGQGEALSKTGAKGLYAAREWIDAYCRNTTRPAQDFPLYLFDRWYPGLVDRSRAGRP